jgi:hypothetical protein
MRADLSREPFELGLGLRLGEFFNRSLAGVGLGFRHCRPGVILSQVSAGLQPAIHRSPPEAECVGHARA